MASFKQNPHSRIGISRLKTSTCIIKAHRLSIITFVQSARIILTWPILQVINASFLWPCFFKIILISIANSTKLKLNTTIPSPLLETNLRLFSSRVLKNLLCLWSISEQRLSEISNISRRKYKIELFTCNTFNLFLCNLTNNMLLQKTYCINTYIKILSY